ncbi:MAG: recombinase family protein [Actinomycetota bacterium]
MNSTTRRAGIYLRISSDPEETRLGVIRQLEDCRARCDANGWLVVDVYEDNDRSAYKGKPRAEYRRMLGDVESGRIDAVVVWAQDRLTRHPRELEEFFDIIDRVGDVALVTISGDRDLSDPGDLMMARVEGAFAAKESADKAARHRRKALELAEAGKVGGGGARPFGFEADRVTVREPEAVLIREAAERLLAGDSQGSVLRDWEAKGVTTPTGGRWRYSTFRRMMQRPRLAGLREHQGEVIGPAEWGAIITPETHERLGVRLKGTGRHRVNRERLYLLTGGPIVCGLCGAGLVAARRDGKRTMVCPSGPGRPGCGRLSILAEPVEDLVGGAVIEALDGPMLAQAIAADRRVGDRDAELSKQIGVNEEALARAAEDHYLAGIIDRTTFIKVSRALQGEIDALRSRLTRTSRSRILTTLPHTRQALQAAWDDGEIGWRRGLVMAVIDRIEVSPATRGRNRFDPQRLTITWHA